MNISKFLNKLSLGCGLAALCISTQATAAYYGDNCCAPAPSCCPAPCCEDGPLSCGSFGALLKGGVTPSWFTDRGDIYVTNPSLENPVYNAGKAPQFDKIFDLPWQIGAELQWNASTHVQFFGEYVYENAKGKGHRFFNDAGLVNQLNLRNGEFQTSAVYLGARYYFGNIWCSDCGTSSIAPFVGFKAGAKWHQNTRSHNEFIIGDTVYDLGSDHFFRDQTLISAGAQFGLDYSFNCNWGVVFMVEVVGTQSLRNNRNVNLLPIVGGPGAPTAISLGETGHILSVPITLGVRYTF